MVLSMTGYGKGIVQTENITVVAELKSLNGKSTDIRCRLPLAYKEQEIQLRNLILEKAHRGKMDYSISIESEQGTEEYSINKGLFKKYYKQIEQIQRETGIGGDEDLIGAILRMPEVVSTTYTEVDEEEFKAVRQATEKAIVELNKFRAEEGVSLYEDLNVRCNNIKDLLNEVEKYEQPRIDRIKERMNRQLEEKIAHDQIDKNRFEQEIIYYIEKLDINEEKVRLSQHCKYFGEILSSDTLQVGKKLGFVAQEMGREINTLGSKAQDKDLQKIVVNMKDQLEKIKEQLFNVV